MDLDFLRTLIDIVEDSDLETVELEHEGTRVKLSKASSKDTQRIVDSSNMIPGDTVQPSTQGATSLQATASEVENQENSGFVEIKSPMVGTLYAAPSPEAENYVQVGSKVNQGDVLCILEAMKLMNELEAEVSGTVEKICVQNGDPVQYGQVLFLINPS